LKVSEIMGSDWKITEMKGIEWNLRVKGK